MDVGHARRALVAATLVAVASPLAGQDPTLADLKPGARAIRSANATERWQAVRLR